MKRIGFKQTKDEDGMNGRIFVHNLTIFYFLELQDDVYKSMVQNYLHNTQSNQELATIDNKVCT